MGIADVFGALKRVVGGGVGRVFGNAPMGSPTTIPDSGVNFDYQIINIPGKPNENSQRNWSVNDAALPFTPEEYKKLRNEYDSMTDLKPAMRDRMFKEVLKKNPKWVPGENEIPKEKLSPSSSAVSRLRILPDNKIGVTFTNGTKEYTYVGNGTTVSDAAKAVLELINSRSIGRALNKNNPTSWGNRHYDNGHA